MRGGDLKSWRRRGEDHDVVAGVSPAMEAGSCRLDRDHGRVAKKPRSAEDIFAAVTRQQGVVDLGMVEIELARVGWSMRLFANFT